MIAQVPPPHVPEGVSAEPVHDHRRRGHSPSLQFRVRPDGFDLRFRDGPGGGYGGGYGHGPRPRYRPSPQALCEYPNRNYGGFLTDRRGNVWQDWNPTVLAPCPRGGRGRYRPYGEAPSQEENGQFASLDIPPQLTPEQEAAQVAASLTRRGVAPVSDDAAMQVLSRIQTGPEITRG